MSWTPPERTEQPIRLICHNCGRGFVVTVTVCHRPPPVAVVLSVVISPDEIVMAHFWASTHVGPFGKQPVR